MITKYLFRIVWLGVFLCGSFMSDAGGTCLDNCVLPERDKDVESFSFAVAGDTHVGRQTEAPLLELMVELLNKSGAEFFVHLGDKIQGSASIDVAQQRYMDYKRAFAKLNIPVYHTMGNHEAMRDKAMEGLHVELFGPLYRSFHHKGSLFLILNTESVGFEGSIEDKQFLWLEEELKKAEDYRHIFIFMHRPLFSALSTERRCIHFSSIGVRDRIKELFLKYNVRVVFAGHEHLYHDAVFEGLRQVISGGAGGPIHFFPMGGFHHFLRVDVSGEDVDISPVPLNN